MKDTMDLRRITYEITYRCNQRCKYCFLWGDHVRRSTDNRTLLCHELSYAEIRDVLVPQLLQSGVTAIRITGGEALLRRDFPVVIHTLKEAGLEIAVETNLSLDLQERSSVLQALAECCTKVWVSIDGIGRTHDSLRGMNNAFRRTVSNLRRLVALRRSSMQQLLVNCIVVPENQSDLVKVVSLVHSLGVSDVRFQLLTWNPVGRDNGMNRAEWRDCQRHYVDRCVHPTTFDGCIAHSQLVKSRDIAHALGMTIHFFPDLDALSPDLIDGWYGGGYGGELWNGCSTLMTKMRIDPYGNMFPCMDLSFGNIRDMTLLDVWNGDAFVSFREHVLAVGPLPDCITCCRQQMRPFAFRAPGVLLPHQIV